MFRHTKYSSPYGRGKRGIKLDKYEKGHKITNPTPDPANGGGKAIMYEGANLDAVSPEKLQQLIKTFQGDYFRPNIDKGYGKNQPYGQPELFKRGPQFEACGLIARIYRTDRMLPGQ